MKRAWPQNLSKLKTSEAFGRATHFHEQFRPLQIQSWKKEHSICRTTVIAHSLQVFQGKMNFLNVANGLQLPFVRVSQKQSSHWFERTDGCDCCSRHASASVQKVRDQGVADSEPGIRTDGKAGAGFRVLSTVTEFQVNQPVT